LDFNNHCTDMNAIKFSLFVHPDSLCVVFKGSQTWRLLDGVEVNITWSSTCTRPKCLHGVVLKFRDKFIFLNPYPAVCWHIHCTYECFFFPVVILPKFYEYQLKVLFAISPYTLRDKRQFRLFKLRVLFGPKKDEIKGSWMQVCFLAVVACRPVKKYSFWNDFTVFISRVSPMWKRRTITFRNLGRSRQTWTFRKQWFFTNTAVRTSIVAQNISLSIVTQLHS
jgi:hypothetical protein